MNEEMRKQTMRKFIRISRLHRLAFETKVSSLGIHQSQHHLLMYLARSTETPSQKEISEHLKVSPAAIAVSLKKLEKEGLIEKSCGSDARTKKITITERGKEIVQASLKMFSDVDDMIFTSISNVEFESLNGYLDVILKNLENINEEYV